MAWSFTDLRYGWKIAVGITLAGTTIYVANNTRWRINQADEIEIALGVYERCLATQTATNPTYAVTPPDFTRSWYSNSYETQVVAGVTSVVAVLHTNIFTNTIGFRTDRAMLVDLDAKIVALIPYYVDTNTVYDGTTNIVMLTVTGLFASLQIGDHTNQFTAVPTWTNNVGQTNETTNAATFGPWAWRNYVVAWQERYKVLNALKWTSATYLQTNVNSSNSFCLMNNEGWNYGAWAEAVSAVESSYPNDDEGTPPQAGHELPTKYTAGQAGASFSQFEAESVGNISRFNKITTTSIVHRVFVYGLGDKIHFFNGGWFAITPTNPASTVFDGYGIVNQANAWQAIWDSGWSSNSYNASDWIGDFDMPAWCEEPTLDDGDGGSEFPPNVYYATTRGYAITDAKFVIHFQFNYCTNKYW